MAVDTKQIDGLSFSITGLENHYDIEKSVYSALSLATLNLNKVGNYSLLIKSDGHHGLLISTDAPRDVIEPVIADIREKTVRGTGANGSPEYVGNISDLEKTSLESFTLSGLTGTPRAAIRAALWLKDMRTGGKNQQFTGIRAGVDSAGTARALLRSDDTDVLKYISYTFDTISGRQNAVDKTRAQADAVMESAIKNRMPPEAYREHAKFEKWNDDITLRSGKIKDIKDAIKDASPKEAVRMQKYMERLQRKNSKDRRRLKRARIRVEDNLLAYSSDVSGLTERIETLSHKEHATTEDKARALGLMKKRDVLSARLRREEQKKQQLLSYEPGTPQYQSRVIKRFAAADATRKIRDQWIKDNPDSELAKDYRKATRKRGAAKLKSGMGRAIHLILAVIGLAVGALMKLYSAVTDIGKNVAKQASNAMGFNMPYADMQGLNRFASARTNLDPDIFSGMFRKVTASFSNPVTLDTEAIGTLAPYLGPVAARLTDFITKRTDRPDTIAYAIINKMMQNTANGIGGARPGFETDEAFAINKAALAVFDQSFADLFSDWYYWVRTEERNGRTTLGQSARKGILDGFIKPLTPEGGDNSASDYEAAKETQENFKSFVAGLKSLKDDVLTKMLVYLGDLLAVVRNFVMKWFADKNLFPEYVAAESAAAEASNEEGRSVLGKLRDGLEPVIQEHAETYGRGATPEARKRDFLDRMERVKNGNISALPENMPVSEFYDTYGGIVSYYQALENKLKEFDTAHDPKTGLTMHVNWSLDYVNSVAGGMARKALRETRNTADKTISYLEPGFTSGPDRDFAESIQTAIRAVDSDVRSVRMNDLNAVARILGIDRTAVTREDRPVFRQQALERLEKDRDLLERAFRVITVGGLKGLSGSTAAERGRLDTLLDRYSFPTGGSFRAADVPRSNNEAAKVSEKISLDNIVRGDYVAMSHEIDRWVDENGQTAKHYLEQGWKMYASTDSAKDLTITIKLVDPKGKERIITGTLPTLGGVHYDNVPVTGILGQDISTFLEAADPID
jgi:hypothetical protein